MSKTPKLRFKEFSGEWESKKFKDIVKINQGLQIAISERYTEDGENRLFYITNEFLKEGSEKKYFIENPSKSVICNESDILMTRTGNTGKVITGVSGAFHNNFFKISYDSNIHNKMFLYYTLTSFKLQKSIIRLAGTSTIPDLNHGDFYNIKISYPSIEEQEKIASFFSLIDDKISLQGEKVEALKDYKKGMMQKIFSRELRFKDDDGRDYPEWEEKKLGDITEFLKGKELSKSDISQVGNIPCILYGELFTQYGAVINEIKSKCLIEKGTLSKKFDILMPTSDVTPEGLATASCIMMDNVYLGGDINILRPKNNINGIFLSYQVNHFKNYIINRVSGTTVKHIYVKDIKDIKYLIPCESEQRKISGLFVKIDIKIKLEQEKLDYLNKYKKGLLQQMFV